MLESYIQLTGSPLSPFLPQQPGGPAGPFKNKTHALVNRNRPIRITLGFHKDLWTSLLMHQSILSQIIWKVCHSTHLQDSLALQYPLKMLKVRVNEIA